MKPLDHAKLADALLPAVLAAARIEMRHFAAGVAVELKPDASPVTAADREAEAVLLDGISRAARGRARDRRGERRAQRCTPARLAVSFSSIRSMARANSRAAARSSRSTSASSWATPRPSG